MHKITNTLYVCLTDLSTGYLSIFQKKKLLLNILIGSCII